jgi:hypothetical protein
MNEILKIAMEYGHQCKVLHMVDLGVMCIITPKVDK